MQRKNLCADGLYQIVRGKFNDVPEHRSNLKNVKVSMPDALSSALAVFAFKMPSLLTYDRERENPNLKSLFKIQHVPSDTQLREILDPMPGEELRPAYDAILRELQKGKALEEFQFLNGRYLIVLDGTGFYASSHISCPQCLRKNTRSDGECFYHQLLGASIVHPDIKQVIPLFPEAIIREDGQEKNDCERNASIRWVEKFRRHHPKMSAVIIEDSLASNVPHLRHLEKHRLNYICGVKPAGHKYLFEQFGINKSTGLSHRYDLRQVRQEKVRKEHHFHLEYINGLELNASHAGFKVNMFVCTESISYVDQKQDKKGRGIEVKTFSWVTDIPINDDNVFSLMRAARRRWAIENENFKTLKEETSYNLEHNYGHGKQNLATNFGLMCVLSFLIDQTLEFCCSSFAKALGHAKGRCYLWDTMRAWFRVVILHTWTAFLEWISDPKKKYPQLCPNTS